MKKIFFFIFVCLFLTIIARKTIRIQQFSHKHFNIARKFSYKTCKICVDLAADVQNDILTASLNKTLNTDCTSLCSFIEQKTSKIEVITACNLLCDMVGINKFLYEINKAKMDSILFCELLNVCSTHKQDENDKKGDANLTRFIFKPDLIRIGSKFDAFVFYISFNGTNTGEMQMRIKSPNGTESILSYLIQSQSPGIYEEIFDFEAKSKPDCKNSCLNWHPGLYSAKISNNFFIFSFNNFYVIKFYFSIL